MLNTREFNECENAYLNDAEDPDVTEILDRLESLGGRGAANAVCHMRAKAENYNRLWEAYTEALERIEELEGEGTGE